MHSFSKRLTLAVLAVSLGLFAMFTPACGGTGIGGSEGAGRGLVLLSFMQDGVANAVLNTRLELRFSEAVDGATVNASSIQIREGDGFGASVPGVFIVQGESIIFEPRLASLCDQSDSGLKPDTAYRVQCIGHPEEFAVRNMSGQPLSGTTTHEFHTRADNDPDKYDDQIPATAPVVTFTSPLDGEQAVAVADGNQIVLDITENLDPCSVSHDSISFRMYEIGDPDVFADVGGGRMSGFTDDGTNTGDTSDQTLGDPFSWGAGGNTTTLGPPQDIPATLTLTQDFHGTQIVIQPLFGKFPENALIVVQLSFDVEDFGHTPLTPHVFSFTTENLPAQSSSYVMEVEGETPFDKAGSTADIDSARALSKVQGYMLFAGDGDNGAVLSQPSLPQSNPPLCTNDYQSNAGGKDDYDPTGPSAILDTGSTPNECLNLTDGSTAVVWEFNTFRIRDGVTVRVIGVNPAIILVQGDAVIENGGFLMLRGDNQGGSPQSRGGNGDSRYDKSNHFAKGGVGVAGAGYGGSSAKVAESQSPFRYGQDGFAGFGSDDYDPAMSAPAYQTGGPIPLGGGGAGSPSGSVSSTSYNPWDAGSAAGGGGGHSTKGVDGQMKKGTIYTHKLPDRSFGGEVYGDEDGPLYAPEAGSGGGSAGSGTVAPFQTSASYGASGGAGGAGGGFIDITSSGHVHIFGTIDAMGSRGGDGDGFSAYGASAGGGGGSGGAVRILTPNDIIIGATTLITTAGGTGGAGFKPYSSNNPNHGGAGGVGRIALEDSNGIIAGIAGATLIPNEGEVGFYRGQFDATRFKGGGLEPQAISEPFPVGPFNPVFLNPIQDYGTQEDFIAGVPTIAAIGTGKTAIMIEARAYQMKADGTPDLTTETDWFTVGHFTDTAIAELPAWHSGHPSTNPLDPDYLPVPSDNALDPGSPHGDSGDAFTALNAAAPVGNGFEFLQLRITMELPASVGPFDGGPFIDRWRIHFSHDQ